MSVPRGVALLVAGALFMEILDATIITPAIPLIASSLGVEAVDVNIAISAYLVTVAVLIPVSGWIADRFGTRRVFIAAIAVFTLASVGCAASVSLPMLVAMRVVQGVGGALMVPVGRLLVLRSSGKADLVRTLSLLTETIRRQTRPDEALVEGQPRRLDAVPDRIGLARLEERRPAPAWHEGLHLHGIELGTGCRRDAVDGPGVYVARGIDGNATPTLIPCAAKIGGIHQSRA